MATLASTLTYGDKYASLETDAACIALSEPYLITFGPAAAETSPELIGKIRDYDDNVPKVCLVVTVTTNVPTFTVINRITRYNDRRWTTLCSSR